MKYPASLSPIIIFLCVSLVQYRNRQPFLLSMTMYTNCLHMSRIAPENIVQRIIDAESFKAQHFLKQQPLI